MSNPSLPTMFCNESLRTLAVFSARNNHFLHTMANISVTAREGALPTLYSFSSHNISSAGAAKIASTHA